MEPYSDCSYSLLARTAKLRKRDMFYVYDILALSLACPISDTRWSAEKLDCISWLFQRPWFTLTLGSPRNFLISQACNTLLQSKRSNKLIGWSSFAFRASGFSQPLCSFPGPAQQDYLHIDGIAYDTVQRA